MQGPRDSRGRYTPPPPTLNLDDHSRTVAPLVWEAGMAGLRVCLTQVRGDVNDDMTPRQLLALDNDENIARMQQSMSAGW